SRRRHTILQGDWSSDVCSSDLGGRRAALALPDARAAAGSRAPAGCARAALAPGSARARSPVRRASRAPVAAPPLGGGGGWRPSRSEERRVGKEGRLRWSVEA